MSQKEQPMPSYKALSLLRTNKKRIPINVTSNQSRSDLMRDVVTKRTLGSMYCNIQIRSGIQRTVSELKKVACGSINISYGKPGKKVVDFQIVDRVTYKIFT